MPRSDNDNGGARDGDAAVVVRVVRSGGFAGLKREWTAVVGADEASVWIALLEDCPWDDASTGSSDGADRFVWLIDARFDSAERTARVGDGDLHGPWRTLVDAVRESAAPAEARRVAGRRR